MIETFRNGDARPVYRRFRGSGRRMPDGIVYVSSSVTADLARCSSNGSRAAQARAAIEPLL